MDKEQFLEVLCDKFPNIKEEVLDEDYQGLFTLQIGVFMRYTQEAINHHQVSTVGEHTQFITEIFDLVEEEVRNSLVLSYIGKLDFKNIAKPQLYKDIQAALDAYNQSAYTDQKLINFIKKRKN